MLEQPVGNELMQVVQNRRSRQLEQVHGLGGRYAPASAQELHESLGPGRQTVEDAPSQGVGQQDHP